MTDEEKIADIKRRASWLTVGPHIAVSHDKTDYYEGDVAVLVRELRRREWQPIVTAPKDGSLILIWPRDDEHATAYWLEGMWRLNCCGQLADKITHWMPLPQPPSD